MTKWKRNNYRFWHSPLALALLFCILIFFGYKIIGLIEKEKETAYKKELVLEKIENLKNKESSLSLGISKLETDEGQEEIIREKYQVAKNGEKMVIIVDEDEEGLPLKEQEDRHGFLNWLKDVFKK